MVEDAFSLCGACWRETPFIEGTSCDTCGASLPGMVEETAHCDDCMRIPRPWDRGRAALAYRDKGRSLILALKHGDRQDLARPAARWLCKAGADLFQENSLLVPIPLHWTRLLMRRFNQSAHIANELGRQAKVDAAPDALQRTRRTPVQDGKGVSERFENISGAIKVHPRRRHRIAGRSVILVDDVMTSGATLAEASEACFDAGAASVSILVLARVCKDS